MFKKSPILFSGFLLILLIGISHNLAVTFYFYWIYWWFDIAVHFIAGLGGGLVAYWLFFERGLWPWKKSFGVAVAFIVAGGLAVGGAWEIFEYYYGLTESHEGHAVDTGVDLFMDGMGCLIAAIIGHFYTLKKNA